MRGYICYFSYINLFPLGNIFTVNVVESSCINESNTTLFSCCVSMTLHSVSAASDFNTHIHIRTVSQMSVRHTDVPVHFTQMFRYSAWHVDKVTQMRKSGQAGIQQLMSHSICPLTPVQHKQTSFGQEHIYVFINSVKCATIQSVYE